MQKLDRGTNMIHPRTGQRVQQRPPKDRELNMMLDGLAALRAAMEAKDSERLDRVLAHLLEVEEVCREYLYTSWRKPLMERWDAFLAWREQCVGKGTRNDFLSHAALYGSYLKWCHANARHIESSNALTRWIGQDLHVDRISKERRGVYGLVLLPPPDEVPATEEKP